jgi:hypothetical protein
MVLATLQGLPMNFIWRSLPFVFDNFTLAGAIEFDASKGSTGDPTGFAVRFAYSLYGAIQNYPWRYHRAF